MFRTLSILSVAIGVASAVPFEEHARTLFDQFKIQYDRSYTSPAHESERFEVFKSNLAVASELQRLETGTARYGVTKFMDMSPKEFGDFYLMPNLNRTEVGVPTLPPLDLSDVEVPKTDFDWSSKGAVTPVYNQGQCGSCWAFSATETIESFHAIAGKGLIGLSQQQIVDCDRSDYGCRGGWTYNAYKYVQSAGGQDTLSSYPYTARDGQCRFNPSNVAAKLSGWGYVTQSRDENAMASFLTSKGPISVCVDASSWQFYQGGVLSRCGGQIDHCVQATGIAGTAWHVRNSWGANWGEQGYIRILRGNNVCAIAEVPTYVQIAA
jgi:hypothetical protein